MTDRGLYLDHAATTPCSREAWAAMTPYFLEEYGNPNSMHSLGRHARHAIDDARARIAACVGATAREIAITGGGTEANNMAIRGAAKLIGRGRHIVTSSIEHVSTLRTCARLEEEGFRVTYVPPDAQGRTQAAAIAAAVRKDTMLVTLSHANNEIGTIQDISAIADAARSVNSSVLVHCDAVQTAGHLPLDVEALGVDLLTLTAHKFYGPKGIAAIYVRSGVEIRPLLYGGGDERKLRVGTESVPLAVGMAVALEHACSSMEARDTEWRPVRDALFDGLAARLPGVLVNGDRRGRLATNVNVSIAGVKGEDLVLLLDRKGICASTGSACTTGRVEPSHVLLAIGRDRDEALGAVRLTFGDASRGVEVTSLVETIARLAEQQRAIAPRRTYEYAFAGSRA
jgi:cysteine desulfurase